MLGRSVAERIEGSGGPLFADEVVAAARSADLFVLNLECCISDRGDPWPAPGKPFFFRAPPEAVEHLQQLGVDAVTLANNHALDYGTVALRDTLDHLAAAGIGVVGAGRDHLAARQPLRLSSGDQTVDVIAVTDHPVDFAATADRAGTAYADLRRDTPAWLRDAVADADADVVLVTPHWGPNMTDAPVRHVRHAADALLDAGATLIAGHSAHVFHGVRAEAGRVVCFDLGDFVDDYAVEPRLRNDLGLLWFVDIEHGRPVRLEALPLALDFCYTRPAVDDEHTWIVQRLTDACAALGTDVDITDGRVAIALPGPRHPPGT
jgi:poly-gamma-glutamate synthesis protein (capsule biosynthesis protein)